MKTLALLCYEFFKTGLFSVGGGMATLPFLYDMAAKYPWFTAQQLTDMIAISEATPGPVGVNMATYAGFTTAGILGGILATLSLVAPAIVIIVLIAKFLARFNENKNIEFAFYGLRPAVTGLIAAATFEVFKLTIVRIEPFEQTRNFLQLFNWINLVIFIALFVLIMKTKWHPAIMIAAGAGAGILLKL